MERDWTITSIRGPRGMRKIGNTGTRNRSPCYGGGQVTSNLDLLLFALINVPGLAFAWWLMHLPEEPLMPKPMSARQARRADRQLQEVNGYLRGFGQVRDEAFERELDAELFALVPQAVQQFTPHFVEWLGAVKDVFHADFDTLSDIIDVPISQEMWFNILFDEA